MKQLAQMFATLKKLSGTANTSGKPSSDDNLEKVLSLLCAGEALGRNLFLCVPILCPLTCYGKHPQFVPMYLELSVVHVGVILL